MQYLVLATSHPTEHDPNVSLVLTIEMDSVEDAGGWLEAVRQRMTGVTSELLPDHQDGWWFATVRGTVGMIAVESPESAPPSQVPTHSRSAVVSAGRRCRAVRRAVRARAGRRWVFTCDKNVKLRNVAQALLNSEPGHA